MKKVYVFATLLLMAGIAFAQQDANFGATLSSNVDAINLFTLVPTINIPVARKTGAIPFDFTLNASQTCDATSQQSKNQIWVCNGDFGGYSTGGSVTASFSNQTRLQCPNTGFADQFTNFAIQSSNGNFNHPIIAGTGDFIEVNEPASGSIPQGNCTPQYSFTDVVKDDFGITATISVPVGTLTSGGTHIIFPGATVLTKGGNFGSFNSNGVWTLQDPFGNKITQSSIAQPITYTDTLGVSTITYNGGTWRSSTNGTVTYPDTTGTTQTITLVRNPTALSEYIPGTCPGGGQSSSFHPVTSITFPDTTSMSFTYEAGGQTGTYTGRVASFTTKQGGTVAYGYSLPCTTYPNTLTRTTADGTTTYTAAEVIQGSNGYQTTTVLDPGQNKTVYTFNLNDLYFQNETGNAYTSWNNFVTEKDVYQNVNTVQSPTYALLGKDIYCYNTNLINCPAAAVTYPITQRDIYHYIGTNATLMSHETETYDSFGDIVTDTVVDSITGQTLVTTTTYGSYSNGTCTAVTGIPDLRCTVTTTSGSNQLAQKRFSYNSNGAPTSATTWISNTNLLTTNYTPNANGTIASVQSPNLQTTTYTYGACNSLLQTASSTTVNGIALTTGTTWDCNAALPLTSTDYNSNKTTLTYDSMLRPSSDQDQLGFTINNLYTSNSATVSWSMTNPSASSSTTISFDGLGRPVNSQTTHGSSYDTTSTAYGFNGPTFQTQTSEPCNTTTIGTTGCTTFPHTALVDVMGRPQSTSTTSNETVTYGYSGNDAQVTLTPVPSGENQKFTVTEYDGFGRPSSVCGVFAGIGSGCQQTSGNHNGVFTTYTYTLGAGSSTVAASRGSQTHTTVYDAAGRVTSETYPESGTTTYTYDSVAAGYCDANDAAYSSPGNLVATQDGAGNRVCSKYDALNRITDTDTNHNISRYGGLGSVCRHFRYDSKANLYNSNGWGTSTFTNPLGKLIETDTEDCAGSLITSQIYSYDANGRMTSKGFWDDGSNGAHFITAAYYLNGAVSSAGGPAGSYTQGIDANGNPVSWTAGTTPIVKNITYDSGGRVTNVQVNNTNDTDTYSYDPKTGNMINFTITVNGHSLSGLSSTSWNANGTLASLPITDGFNSGGTQTCTFGYDDVGRLTSDNCGSNFSQTFSYDTFNNLIQAGSFSWNPGYNSSNNQITGATYDGAGRVTNDTVNQYSYDAYGSLVAVKAQCGALLQCFWPDASGAITVTNYPAEDPLGTKVIEHGPGGITVLVYNVNGGGTYAYDQRVDLPGGGRLYDNSTGSNYGYEHPDWLGSSRIVSLVPQRTVYADRAFAPYGQVYDMFGTTVGNNFTGLEQDVFAGLYDTPTPGRELSQNSGRFQVPDQAHADWNAYAYVTDPNTQTDRSGLNADEQDECMEGGDPCPQTSRQQQQDDSCANGSSECLTFHGGRTASIPDIPPQGGTSINLADELPGSSGVGHPDDPGPSVNPIISSSPGPFTGWGSKPSGGGGDRGGLGGIFNSRNYSPWQDYLGVGLKTVASGAFTEAARAIFLSQLRSMGRDYGVAARWLENLHPSIRAGQEQVMRQFLEDKWWFMQRQGWAKALKPEVPFSMAGAAGVAVVVLGTSVFYDMAAGPNDVVEPDYRQPSVIANPKFDFLSPAGPKNSPVTLTFWGAGSSW